MTASTYGKMSYEVKERLAKQYGTNPPQLSKLRMIDLIFYNPSENPMSQSSKKVGQKPKCETDPDGRNIQAPSNGSGSDLDSDPDDPSEEKETRANKEGNETADGSNLPVPQVRIGDHGQIIIAPESLVLKRKGSEVLDTDVVEERSFADSNKKNKTFSDRRAWTYEETVQFYKVLHTIGTDFSMMREMFPKRTRANLKSKFKREERKNPTLIDKVLRAQGQTLNLSDVEKDLSADKTLRRLGLDGTIGRNCEKKSMIRAAVIDKTSRSVHSTPAGEGENAVTKEVNAKQTTSDTDEESRKCSRDPSKDDEDAVFKRPNNIRPLRKRRLVRNVPAFPEKRKKESTSGKVSKENSGGGEDAVFKKPRIPKKRKVCRREAQASSPEPVKHMLPTIMSDGDEESDDTDDSASLNGDEDCITIKADVKGPDFRYSRSVRVNCADPDLPIDVNETIEHDRPQTPMSDTSSVADLELGSDSEASEEVEVVTINVNEIASYLERTGAVVVESSAENGEDVGDSSTGVDEPTSDSESPALPDDSHSSPVQEPPAE